MSRLKIFFLSLFLSDSTVGQVCKDSYKNGFYDPCLDSDCNFECSDPTKTVTVADPEDCSKYFLCQDDGLVPQKCPPGQLFNMNYHRCAPEKPGYDKCQDFCADSAMRYKGFIRDPTTRVARDLLSTNLQNNVSTQTNVTTCQEDYDNGFYDPCHDAGCNFKCSDQTKTITVADPEDCSKYFLCKDDGLEPQTCREGNNFNMKLHRCTPIRPGYDTCQTSCEYISMAYKNFIVYPTEETNQSTIPEQTQQDTMTMDTHEIKTTITSLPDISSMSSHYGYLSIRRPTVEEIFLCYTPNCIMCHTSEICSECSPGNNVYYIGFCMENPFPCNASNCQHCDDQDVCSLCNAGYYLHYSEQLDSMLKDEVFKGNCTVFECDVANCLSCSDQNFCFSCEQGYIPASSGVCHANCNIENCATCLNESFCSRCDQNFNLTTNGTCILDCNIENCATCFNGSFCSRCDQNFNLTINGTCVPISKISCNSESSNKNDDTNDCVTKEFIKIFKELTQILEDVNNLLPAVGGGSKAKTSLIPVLARDLSKLTGPGNLTPYSLNITILSLKRLTDIRSIPNDDDDDVQQDEITSVMTVVSNVLNESNSKSWSILTESDEDIAITIMKTVDSYLIKIDPEVQQGQILENLAINAIKINDEEKVIKFNQQRPEVPSYDKPLNPANRNPNPNQPLFDNISLSSKFFESSDARVTKDDDDDDDDVARGMLNKSPQAPIVYTAFYLNLNKYLPVQENNSFLASKIVVITTSVLRQQRVEGGVNITFSHTNISLSIEFLPSCVFWNYSIGRNGAWSTDGCRVLWINENATTCSCDHMTNFALLMSTDHAILVHDLAISLISIIGCIISIISLVLTIILLVSSWKRTKMFNHYVTLVNLCIALIIANVIFITGIDKTQPRELCIAIATMLHFFYLSAFFLMLAEGVQLLIYVIIVFPLERKVAVIIVIAAWALAFVVVGISLLATKTTGYGTFHHCWLSTSNSLIWAFIGPALLIIVINICILFIVLCKARMRKIAQEKVDLKSHVKRSLWNVVVISPLLGVTWVFGVLAVSQSLVAFQYIFAVVNSLQGFFIFVFHGFFNHLRQRKGRNWSISRWKFSKSRDKDKQCNGQSGKEPDQGKQNGGYFKDSSFSDSPRISLSDEFQTPTEMYRMRKESVTCSGHRSRQDRIFNNSFGSQSTESTSVASVETS